jgi:hypothetical protein
VRLESVSLSTFVAKAEANFNCSVQGLQADERSAMMYSLIQSAKLNDVDPQVADVLAHIAETPRTKLADLLPWNWA